MDQIVTFYWSTKHGRCYDCGLPAAFFTVSNKGDKEITPEQKLCAVCAANHACEGEVINRIEELFK
jgi:hypothetical protein